MYNMYINNPFRIIRLFLSKEARDPLYVAIANLSASIIGAIFWLIFAYITEPSIYGEVNYYISIASVSALLSLLALDTSSVAYISKGNKDFFIEAFILELLISIIVSVIVSVIFTNIILALIIIGNNLFAMAIANLLGNKEYKRFSIAMIINKLIQISLSLSLYFIIGQQGVLLGYAIAYIVIATVMLSRFKIKYIKEHIMLKQLRGKIRFILSAYTLHISGAKLLFIDKLVIAPLFGFETLGLYQLGFQFLMFLGVIPSSLFQYLLPEEASNVDRRLVKRLGIISSIVIALIFFFASPFLINTFFPKYINAIDNARIMSFGVIPMSISSIIVSSSLGKENAKVVLFGSLAYIGSLIPLFIVLGNTFGIFGLGLSVVIALSLQTVTLLIMSRLFKV